jgi:hypothetical protein
MLALKYLLMILGAGLFGSAGALVAYDVFLSEQLRRLLSRGKTEESGAEVGALARRPFRPMRWRLALQLTIAGALALLITESFVVIPDGAAGIRVSEIWGPRPGTLYPGVHWATPLVDSAAIYDTREQVYSTLAADSPKHSGDVQIMLVPMDGKNFFANDVMRSAFSGVTGGKDGGSSDDNPDDPALRATAAAQHQQPRRP